MTILALLLAALTAVLVPGGLYLATMDSGLERRSAACGRSDVSAEAGEAPG